MAFTEADSSALETLTIADPLHPEQGAHEMKYPRPGKANATVRLAVTSASGRGQPRWVTWDAKAYPYLATVVWPEGGPLTLLVQNREQTEEVLLAADTATGRTRMLLTETDAAWLNLDQSFPHWRKDGKGFYWLTERNGAPEVELRGVDGARLSTWVKGEAGFADLVGVDEATDTLYFTGSPNPTETLLWRVRAGGAPERVATPDAGPASVGGALGAQGRLLVVTTSTLTAMPRTFVLRADGTPVGQLPEVAAEPPLKVNASVQKVGEGEGHWTMLVKPEGHRPGQKLPVVVSVYGGPTSQTVRHAPVALLDQWLANQGYL
ncbi:MAG: DPP IV N-terminal domain-containing protein, partial [Myxococcaceae bacterium]|nr:DPP IV N-terminal domain-containing protein [Myxococcaceae bacterium]